MSDTVPLVVVEVCVPEAIYIAACDYINGRFDVGELTGEDVVHWADVYDYLVDAGHHEHLAEVVVTLIKVHHQSEQLWPHQ